MVLLFKLLIVLFSFLIIKSKGEQRLAFFYTALFLIPETISVTPVLFYFKEHLIFVTCFFISLMYHGELNLSDFKNTGIYKPLIFVFIAYLLVGAMDERLSLFKAVYRATYTFEGTYFAFLVGWLAVNPKQGFNISVFLKKALRYTLIATVFGAFTFFLKTNPVLDAIGLEGRFEMSDANLSIRAFRVTSFFVSSSVYGLACGYLCFMGVVFLRNKNAIDIVSLILLFLNCIWSGTRAAIFPVLLLFVLFFFLVFGLKVSKIMQFAIIACTIFFTLFLLFPGIIKDKGEQYVTMYMSLFNDESQEEVGGSSMDARVIQIATAMEYLKEKPLFGHGMGYAKEILANGKDDYLLGMESYLCFLGVEYGCVFMGCIIFFFISLFFYYYKKRHVNKEQAIVGMFMLLCFILFIIFAWVGDSWLYVLPLLGVIAKMIYCNVQFI